MCDQLRSTIGCTGARHPEDAEHRRDGQRGVLSNAYVQSPIYGPSRMSFYTGRYIARTARTGTAGRCASAKPTLGDHLKKIGVRNVLVGKTHMAPDLEGLKNSASAGLHHRRARVDAASSPMSATTACIPPAGRARPTTIICAAHGYDAPDPWEHWADSGAAEDGTLQNGWLLVHADKAARVPDGVPEHPA